MCSFNYDKLALRAWEADILKLVGQIHEHKGRQELFIRQKPVELERLVEIAMIQSTEFSNKIEGIVTTSTRMKQLMNEKTTPRNRDEDEILGYRDVLKMIHQHSEYIPIRPSYILQLHKYLFKPSGSSYGGHFKSVQNYINETRLDGTVITRFIPVAPYETLEAMERVCLAYERAITEEKIDPLILIPTFISDFLCIHPFNDGNGRMARLLTLLLLYQNGYNVGKYISLEKQIEETKDRYYETLAAVDVGWYEEKNDPTPFIRYILQVILACSIEFEKRVDLIHTRTKSTAYVIVKNYIQETVGSFTSTEVIAHCPSAGRSSVLSVLKKLVKEGYIEKKGSGRGTYYIRKKEEEI